MPTDLLVAFVGYAFVTTITPGPNNAMLLASGTNYGFVRTLPHMAGVVVGFGLMVAAVGFGAGAAFAALPGLYDVLRAAGAAYLLYLAWRIARAGAPSAAGSGEGHGPRGAAGRPLGFLGAAAFQWVNPKAWMMVMGAVSVYLVPGGGWVPVLVIAGIYMVVAVPCVATWAGFGVAMRRVLTAPLHVRVFNGAMALVLCLSLYPVVADALR